eukprot:Tbor_TRINITY_DN3108_c0_g1::TRINITY_DN3108_c0_g1_i2::g.14668::m.14668/K02977/RP-S27Ae, RPS27A; small subunit ribosomal protein S27Ae
MVYTRLDYIKVMQVFVREASGITSCVPVFAQQTVASLKSRLALAGDLFFAGRLLEDDVLIAEQMASESTIYETMPVMGGKGKKKKKRVFTKPKKNSHRHKLETMRVLKYYTVTGDGENEEFQIKRNLTECRHPQCGPGVFMAKHKDGRQTCGKCSMTFKPIKK